jgi:hypothetical protein
MWKRSTSLAVLAAMGGIGLLGGAEQPPAKPKTLMQRKLDHAQRMLEGLAVEDYALIAQHARAMNDLGLLEKSRHAESMSYQTQLQVFRFANDELVRLAEEKNLEGALLAYTQMTISCVNCHKYLRQQAQ